MYNENYPNNYEQEPRPQDGGRNAEPQAQEPAGEQREKQSSSYEYHNYYADRYREGQQEREGGRRGGYGPDGHNGYDSYRQDGRDRKPKKPGRGARIAAVVCLVAVFAVFCTGISWLAVNSLMTQMASVSVEETAEQEEENLPEQTEGVSEENGQETEGTGSSQIQSAGTIRESGEVTAVVTDVTDVVEKVMPACVSITSQYTAQFQDFWGQIYSQDEESSGSGIIIGQNDTELLIVTNNHVVEDSDTLYVQFIDGEVATAQVKGTDSTVDLAVLAVNLDEIGEQTKSEICIAQMGDSDNLKIGEPAIAIGNALGYGQSVTTGVISALNRTLEVSEQGTSNALIQTDAAINPGNSGGALLNINGEVIGINSSKIGSNLVEGMGYAIPISTARPIIETLMAKETKAKVSDEERGYLGISCINVTSDLSENFNMPQGVFVAQVYEGTGAAAAGLVRGDIITAFDGTEVKSQEELTREMQYYKAGETVEITIMQGSPTGYQAKNVQVTLCTQEDMDQTGTEEPAAGSGRP